MGNSVASGNLARQASLSRAKQRCSVQEAAGKWGSGADADAAGAAAAAVASAAAAGPDHDCHQRSLLPHLRCCRLHRSLCLYRPHHHLHGLHPHDHPHHRLHLHHLHYLHHLHPHRPCHPCRPCRCDASHWERKQLRRPQHQGSREQQLRRRRRG
ncbi:unnamed protein product [Closterium sp. NIES-53]